MKQTGWNEQSQNSEENIEIIAIKEIIKNVNEKMNYYNEELKKYWMQICDRTNIINDLRERVEDLESFKESSDEKQLAWQIEEEISRIIFDETLNENEKRRRIKLILPECNINLYWTKLIAWYYWSGTISRSKLSDYYPLNWQVRSRADYLLKKRNMDILQKSILKNPSSCKKMEYPQEEKNKPINTSCMCESGLIDRNIITNTISAIEMNRPFPKPMFISEETLLKNFIELKEKYKIKDNETVKFYKTKTFWIKVFVFMIIILIIIWQSWGIKIRVNNG